jgi:hypothetical protein
MSAGRPLRLVGAAALVASAAAFMVGLVALYQIEGPASPNLEVSLAGPAGQGTLILETASLTAAVILLLVGLLVLCSTFPPAASVEATVSRHLTTAATAVFVGFLSLQYALVGVVREGIDPTSTNFKAMVRMSHAATDWGGWSGIVMLAVGLLLIGMVLVRGAGRRLLGWSSIACGTVGLTLIPAGFGFIFTLLLAAWSVVAAVDLIRRGG